MLKLLTKHWMPLLIFFPAIILMILQFTNVSCPNNWAGAWLKTEASPHPSISLSDPSLRNSVGFSLQRGKSIPVTREWLAETNISLITPNPPAGSFFPAGSAADSEWLKYLRSPALASGSVRIQLWRSEPTLVAGNYPANPFLMEPLHWFCTAALNSWRSCGILTAFEWGLTHNDKNVCLCGCLYLYSHKTRI